MKRMFVVGINNITPEQEGVFKKYAEDKRLYWWHWINNFWLLIDTYNTTSCSDIRDKLDLISPGSRNLVLEVHPKTFAGFGPNGEKNNMFQWLQDYWNEADRG